MITRRRHNSPLGWCRPATADPAHQLDPAPPPVLATHERVPPTAAAATAAGHAYNRRADAENKACVRLTPRFIVIILLAVCAVPTPAPPSPTAHMTPTLLAPPSYVSANPYTTPTVARFVHMISCTGDWECVHPAPDANTNSSRHRSSRPPSSDAPLPSVELA